MFDKILVAIDGSESSLKALDTAISIAEQQQSQIALIAVGKRVVFPSMVGVDLNQINDAMKEEYQRILKEAQARADSKALTSMIIYREGDPAQQILELSQKGCYDLIVMGSRGLGALREVILGSVSHKVSQLARCPVLIIK